MQISDETRTILLCCTHLGMKVREKPFALREWESIVWKLEQNGMAYGMLPLFDEADMKRAGLSKQESKRIFRLLKNRDLDGCLREYKQRMNMHIIGQGDRHYPTALHRKRELNAPPLFYAVGNLDLLTAYDERIAIVGKRDCHVDAESICAHLVRRFASPTTCFVSGGARGIDRLAQHAVSRMEGNMMIIVPYGLNEKTIADLSADQNGNYLLLSAEEPRAVFQKHAALQRNAWIYALSNRAFIVESASGSGGTWHGAKQAIQNHWTDVWVWNEPTFEGNQRLLRMGAEPIDYQNGQFAAEEK